MNEEIKARYDRCVETRLFNEYGWFLKSCQAQKVAVISLTFDSFKRRAMSCGYVLGMKPQIDDDCDSVYDEKISFVTPVEIKIPFSKFGNKHSGGRDPMKRIVNIPDIKGFGMSLSLSGWHIFFDKKFTLCELMEKLQAGNSIEDIFQRLESNRNGRLVCVDGRMINLKSACDKTGVPYWLLMSKAKGLSGDELQRCLDSLREKFSPGVHRYADDEIWLKVEEADYNTICEYAKFLNASIPDALHRLIETVKY